MLQARAIALEKIRETHLMRERSEDGPDFHPTKIRKDAYSLGLCKVRAKVFERLRAKQLEEAPNSFPTKIVKDDDDKAWDESAKDDEKEALSEEDIKKWIVAESSEKDKKGRSSF